MQGILIRKFSFAKQDVYFSKLDLEGEKTTCRVQILKKILDFLFLRFRCFSVYHPSYKSAYIHKY